MNRKFPEECDLVRVRMKGIDWFGYVDEIDYDVRSLRVCVEFYPNRREWFDLDQINLVEFPEDKK